MDARALIELALRFGLLTRWKRSADKFRDLWPSRTNPKKGELYTRLPKGRHG